ncbi:MAG: hypothetical protein R2769_06960 [Saprospiraceae bacterium]
MKLRYSISILFFFICLAHLKPQSCQEGTDISFELLFNGQNSMNEEGDPANIKVSLCNPSAAGYTAHTVAWANIDLDPRPLSYCSEFALQFGPSGTYALVFTPGLGEDNFEPCQNNYTDEVDLILEDLTFQIGNTGCIDFEFYETFDDYNGKDGDWVDGSLTITTCNMIVLPVEWLSFNAENKGTSNLLTWQTATETNTEKFQVQKQDLKTGRWEILSEIPAIGNSQIIQTYRWIDETPGFESVYRIASVDLDGSIDYSPIRVLNRNLPDLIIKKQNPFSDYIHLEILNDRPEEILNISLHEIANGKLIYQSQFSANQKIIKLDIPSSYLANGVYALNIWNKFENHTDKLIKAN